MIRRTLILLGMMLLCLPLSAQKYQTIRGWCELGAQPVVTNSVNSTTQVQASYPQCTVTVNVHSGGLATIYSTNTGGAQVNPFFAQSNGQWNFYVTAGEYDVILSGAGMPSSVTYSDITVPAATTTALQFGSTSLPLSSIAPTAGQILAWNGMFVVGTTACTICTGGGGGGGTGGGGVTAVPFDQCTAGNQTDNGYSFWTVQPMTEWDAGHWEFVSGHSAEIYCTVRVPDNFIGNLIFIHLEMGMQNSTANLHAQTCDASVAPTGNFNPSGHGGTGTFLLTDTTVCQPATSLGSHANFDRFTQVFALKSVPVKDSILIVEIHSDGGAGGAGTNLLLFGEYLENQ